MDPELPLLSIQNLELGFGNLPLKVNALNGVSLTINRGEIVAVVGESGSGKSITALSILQLLNQKNTHYSNGSIHFSKNGTSSVDLLTTAEPIMRKIRGNDIAMIFQEPMTALNPVYTCGNQVMEVIRQNTGVSVSVARKQTIELFKQVQLPEPDVAIKKYPHQLSGGQKQRVMIAMAIACKPSLLIADEPTTALDVTVQKSILNLLTNLQAQTKMGLLFITHDLGLVQDFADRVIVMYRGSIVEEGASKELFSNPQHDYTKALLSCRPILFKKGEPLPVVDDFLSPPDESRKTITRIVSNPEIQEPLKEPLLEINALKVWYPHKRLLFEKKQHFTKAVDEVSFDVFRGETLGVVGESGCGKTTLGRAILQLLPSTSGKIIFKGTDLTTLTAPQLKFKRKEFQLVFQDPYGSLNPRLTIGEAIRETLLVHQRDLTNAQQREKVIDLLERVQLLPDHYNRYPHAFSGGQRQRIGIARALALHPDFIVFDESVSALDVSVQAQVLNLINDLKAKFEFTAIFISHDLGVIQYISDRILVMNKGKIAEIGTTEQVMNNPGSNYTKLLLDAIPGQGNWKK